MNTNVLHAYSNTHTYNGVFNGAVFMTWVVDVCETNRYNNNKRERERESKRPFIGVFALSLFLFLAVKRGESNF